MLQSGDAQEVALLANCPGAEPVGTPLRHVVRQFLGRLLRRADATQHDGKYLWRGLDRDEVAEIGPTNRCQHQSRRAQYPQRVHGVPAPHWGASSVAIAAIDSVEQTKIGGPFSRRPPPVVLFILGCDVLADVRCDLQYLVAAMLHHQLNAGGADELLHQAECLTRGGADCGDTVMTHDQRAVPPQRGDNTFALVEAVGEAFVIVIADAIVEGAWHSATQDGDRASGRKSPRLHLDGRAPSNSRRAGRVARRCGG